MAPRSKPRVKHRSSINSKGLKNKVEPRSDCNQEKKPPTQGRTERGELAWKLTSCVCLVENDQWWLNANRCVCVVGQHHAATWRLNYRGKRRCELCIDTCLMFWSTKRASQCCTWQAPPGSTSVASLQCGCDVKMSARETIGRCGCLGSHCVDEWT